jgi:acetyl-CoA carboxylase biotin carboxyl carrier protein
MKRVSSPKPAVAKAGEKASVKAVAKASAKPASSLAGDAASDAALVRELALVLGETHLTEIEMRRGDLRIRVSRHAASVTPAAVHSVAPAQAPAVAAPAVAPAPIEAKELKEEDASGHPGVVASPMVGTAYRRPNPQAKPFVEVGDKVAAGDKVLLVEAMKTFNDVVAHKAGTVVQIFVEDGQPVEFGQPMLVIE